MSRFSAWPAAVVVLIAASGLSAWAQSGSGVATRSSDRVVSPSTVAAYVSHVEDGAPLLDVLVLWRGSSMWFAAGGAHSSSGGGGSTTANMYVTYSGRTLSIAIDRAAATMSINDRELSMREANVVLLDGADAVGGPRIVATHRVEPRIEGRGEPMASIIQRSPELYAFIGCDGLPPPKPIGAVQPSEMAANYMAVICSQMRPQ
jgi:hypothetical protein